MIIYDVRLKKYAPMASTTDELCAVFAVICLRAIGYQEANVAVRESNGPEQLVAEGEGVSQRLGG